MEMSAYGILLRRKKYDVYVWKQDLFGRLMILSKSSREIDQKQAISIYEFTMTLRSLFTPDGEILPCTDKSKLIQAIEDVSTDEQQNTLDSSSVENIDPKVAVVDGMNLVQKLTTKMTSVETVKDLSVIFNKSLLTLTKDFDEIICVFDTYKQDSLKNRTRHLRQKGRDPTQYQVRDETSLKNTPLSRFLSHNQTKSDLTKYLSEKVQLYNKESDKIIITSAAGYTNSNIDIGPFPENNHEEADTLMICLGVIAAERH